MANEAMLKKLKEYHQEELSDVAKYEAFALELQNLGMNHYAGIMRDIAHDEHTHATFVACVLNAIEEE